MTEGTFTDTGRTAIMVDGEHVRIFETFVADGAFAGATFEVLETELPEGAMTTKREIKRFARDTRASLRGALAALDSLDFDTAEDLATQAAGCAGEVENLVQQYVDEHTESRFASGDSR